MVFQSLLSTVTTSAGSGFIGGAFGGGSPPEGGGVLCGGTAKDSPSKHSAYLIGSVRTFNDLPQLERSTRRRADMDAAQLRGRVSPHGEPEAVPPTVGWWRWRAVAVASEGPAAEARDGKATLYAMEQSLSSWERDVNERLNDWQHAEEVKPIFCTSRNYGTFTRRDYLYSGSAGVPSRSASPLESANCAPTERATSKGSGAATQPGGSCERPCEPTQGAENMSFFEHVLRPGDSLSALALKYQVQVNDIARANGISGMGSHASLLVRKSLRIPVLAGSASQAREASDQEPPANGKESTEASRQAPLELRTAKQSRRAAGDGNKAHGQLDGFQCVGARPARADPIAARLASVSTAAATAASSKEFPLS
jgi:LysM repeat protein